MTYLLGCSSRHGTLKNLAPTAARFFLRFMDLSGSKLDYDLSFTR